jgi:hypothetical protein
MSRSSLDKARRAIAREDHRCVDIAAAHGQMFQNVRHMSWFIEIVAEEMYT